MRLPVRKLYEVTLDIEKAINFCSDLDRHLLVMLQNTYAGRCFRGAYIVRVAEIVKRSKCEIMKTNMSGQATINVQFAADVVVFSRWDILTGVKIVKTEQMVVGEYGDGENVTAAVSVLPAKINDTLSVGLRVPIRVVNTAHPPLQKQASIVGILLTCDQKAPAWRLRGALDQNTAAELRPLLDEIASELTTRSELIEKQGPSFWFFETLLYAYAYHAKGHVAPPMTVEAWPGGPKWTGLTPLQEAAGEQRNVLELVHRALDGERVPVAGVWSRDLAIHRTSPFAAVGAVPSPIDESPTIVFASILGNIRDYLVAVREMVQLYDTAMIESHRGIWLTMSAAQTPISAALSAPAS